MSIVNCRIDGRGISCDSGTTILEAAREHGIDIPTLCYFKDLNKLGACRVCVVEIEGMARLMPACVTQVRDGMVIHTENERVIRARRQTIDLLCKNHRMDCEYCPHYTFCELHAVLRRLGMDDRKYSGIYHERYADESSRSIIRDYSKCIRCRRCVASCKRQKVEAIGAMHRAEGTIIGTMVPMSETNCIGCGQCVRSCPTGALFVRDDTDDLWRALNQKKKIIIGIMPEAAVNITRFFGASNDGDEMERLTALCKKIGAYEVFDLNGIRQAALNELTDKIYNPKLYDVNSLSVSMCAAEKYRENRDTSILFTRNLEELFKETAEYYIAKQGISVADLFLVYVSSCAAAKREHTCDAVLTTTELFQWIQRACVSRFTTLDVWKKTQPEQPIRLFESVQRIVDISDAYLVYACPDGCRNGGGQFRTNAYQKGKSAL